MTPTIYLIDHSNPKCFKKWCCSYWNSGGTIDDLIKFISNKFPEDLEKAISFWYEIERQYGCQPIKISKQKPFRIEDHSEEWLRHHGIIGAGAELKHIIKTSNGE